MIFKTNSMCISRHHLSEDENFTSNGACMQMLWMVKVQVKDGKVKGQSQRVILA
jgi:hypothetical protein